MLSTTSEFNKKLRTLQPHMLDVTENRATLTSLESVWDVLNLLGQLSGTTTEMSGTKAAFANLSESLLLNLAQTTYDKRMRELQAPAQVAIDILVRNLYERSADIGFLAMDDALRAHAASHAAGAALDGSAEQAALVARLQAYVAKYSVYRDVILVAPSGRVLARLPGRPDVAVMRDALLRDVLASDAPYTEASVCSDLFPGETRNLFYAVRVQGADGALLGALFLCFDLEAEVKRIFAGLRRRGDWSVITLLDGAGMVIASSDSSQVAPGATPDAAFGDGQLLRFAGRHYLAARRAAQGFQGYMGPGWSALVLVPLDAAFAQDDDDGDDGEDAAGAASVAAPPALVRAVLGSGAAFAPELQRIPAQADAIQRELSRSVWNANIRQGQSRQEALNPAFSKVLLAEIVRTGTRMKDVFTRSIGKLQTLVVASQLDDSQFLAALAIDILDRNLYERANDCRWWALDPLLCSLLEQDGDGDEEVEDSRRVQIAARLAAINDLYTVYDSLLLFDADGVVLGASRPHAAQWVGRKLEAPWCAQALGLSDAERYAVSDFAADPLYDERPTWIYAAALRGAAGRTVGGIAIVFDSAPQVRAMLDAARPAMDGAFTLFIDAANNVIASTDARWQPGGKSALPADLLAAADDGVARLIVLDGQVMAVGARASSGYREYRGSSGAARQAAIAVVCVPLGPYTESDEQTPWMPSAAPTLAQDAYAKAAAGDGALLEIASFHVGHYLLGVPASSVIEAIPFGGFVRLPNTSAKLCGATVYDGATMLIYDLHAALGVKTATPREQMLTVVLEGADGKRFGVLVERLGGIPVVASADVAPVDRVFVGIAPVLASVVKSTQPGEPMLTMLAVEHMAAMLRDETYGDGQAQA